jgi:hypothetical protein
MKDNRRNFLRLLDETWPGLRTAFVQAMRQVHSNVALRALEQAIERGDVQAAFDALRMDAASLYALDEAITAAFATGGKYQMESVVTATKRFPQGARIVQSFGGRNDRAERIARELGSRLVTEVIDDTRDLIAQTIRGGLEAGANPRRTALDVAGRMVNNRRKGGLVGLHSQQAGYVQNMRAELADPERMANYFTRARRDKRFDGIVRRAMNEGKAVSQADIDRIAGRYSDRLLNLRGETIARTETIKALNAGRQEGLDQLVDSGRLDADQIQRKWDATGDARTRPTHAGAEGQTVGKDEPFTVGGYQMMYPGDTSLGAPAGETVNCRCYYAPEIDYFKGLT